MLELFVYQLQSYESASGALSFPWGYDPRLHAGSDAHPGLQVCANQCVGCTGALIEPASEYFAVRRSKAILPVPRLCAPRVIRALEPSSTIAGHGRKNRTMPLPLLQSSAIRLGTIDYAVLALYFLVIFSIGWYFSRKERTTTDYFLASRHVAWWAIGASLFSSNIGSEH